MYWVHGFGPCVHDIVDQSRSLILIRAARILLKRKGIGDRILALYLRADESSNPADGCGAQARCGGATGGLRELRSRPPRGTVTRDFGGKTTRGSTGSLPGAKRGGERLQDGSRRRLSLLRAWAMASDDSDALPASRSSSTPSLWPPLASRPVQWLQLMMFSSNLVAARVHWVSSFAG
jgi:hypothetical protein